MFDRNKSIFFDPEPVVPTVQDLDNHLVEPYLKLRWELGKSQDYGLLLLLDVNGREDELKYTCRITRHANCETGELVFEIERLEDVYINQTIPDLLADRLAYECGKAFYPLLVRVDQEGGVSKVHNHAEIVARWSTVKERIGVYYEGAFVDDYLAKMEKLILSEDVVFNALRNDWLLHVFFYPLYKNYDLQHDPVTRYAPLLPSTMLNYEIEEELLPKVNHFGALSLKQTGNLQLELDSYEAATLAGDYQGLYTLHPFKNHLIAFQGTWTYQDAKVQKKTVVKLFYLPPEGASFDDDFEKGYTNVSLVSMGDITIENDRSKGNFFRRWFNI